MGTSGAKQNKQRQNETYTGHKGIPIDMVNKVRNSICTICIKNKNGFIYGTGFFMKISNSKKYLITNYHIINPEKINEKIEIEIETWNKKQIKLELNNRNVKYLNIPKDITIIEL